MAVSTKEMADLRSAVAPMETAGRVLSSDDDAASRFLDAVHRGDSAEVSRTFEQMGLRGIQHRRQPSPLVTKAASREYLSYQPNERFYIEIVIVVDGKP
jgi:hypothetical protein